MRANQGPKKLSPDLAEQIMNLDDAQMDQLLPLIIRRNNQLRADAETLLFFLPTDPDARVKSFWQVVRSLRAQYGIPEDNEP